MRRLYLLLAALCLWPAMFAGSSEALSLNARPDISAPSPLIVEAGLVCGMLDGKFGCRAASGGVAHGKNASPVDTEATPEASSGDAFAGAPAGTAGTAGEVVKPGEHSCPPGYKVLAVAGPNGFCEPAAATAAVERCPKNSEMLGGKCVHYTAVCRATLAANVNPEPCPGPEEKLVCKVQHSGVRDCCCLTYDKL